MKNTFFKIEDPIEDGIPYKVFYSRRPYADPREAICEWKTSERASANGKGSCWGLLQTKDLREFFSKLKTSLWTFPKNNFSVKKVFLRDLREAFLPLGEVFSKRKTLERNSKAQVGPLQIEEGMVLETSVRSYPKRNPPERPLRIKDLMKVFSE